MLAPGKYSGIYGSKETAQCTHPGYDSRFFLISLLDQLATRFKHLRESWVEHMFYNLVEKTGVVLRDSKGNPVTGDLIDRKHASKKLEVGKWNWTIGYLKGYYSVEYLSDELNRLHPEIILKAISNVF